MLFIKLANSFYYPSYAFVRTLTVFCTNITFKTNTVREWFGFGTKKGFKLTQAKS